MSEITSKDWMLQLNNQIMEMLNLGSDSASESAQNLGSDSAKLCKICQYIHVCNISGQNQLFVVQNLGYLGTGYTKLCLLSTQKHEITSLTLKKPTLCGSCIKKKMSYPALY